jgi:hypothetical protein
MREDLHTVFDDGGYADLLDRLIALNQSNRQRAFNLWPACLPAEWAMSFATVRCDVGRRSGKSTLIKSRATDRDLIVVANELVRRTSFADAGGVTVVTPSRVDATGKGKRFRTIYVDEPSLVFRSIPQRHLYSALARDSEQTFILLGA